MAYWRRRLAPLPQETALPVDFPYPPLTADRPAPESRSRPLPPELADEAVLLAAYVALLHRYSG